MNSENENNPLAMVAALVAAQTLGHAKIIGNNVPAAVLPNDYTLKLLEGTLAVPTRTRGNFSVQTAQAFTRTIHLLRGIVQSNTPALPIFFSRSSTTAQVQAVLNFDNWRDLAVTLTQGLSLPFLDWYRLNGRAQTQRAFALFLEERTAHVVKPEGAALLELARKFKANVSVRYQSVIDAENGDNALEFIQTTEAGTASAKGRMKVPNFITLGLPVWHGGEPVKLEARFGYTIGDEGKLALTFEILRLEELLAEELRKIVEAIARELVKSVVIEGSNCEVPEL